MSQPWPYSGARWRKFDFHIHTPASKETGAWQAVIGTSNGNPPIEASHPEVEFSR